MNELSRPTILLVEDFEDSRVMMRQLLELSGYRVLEATNGEQAVTTARLDSPSLIVTDLSLPLVDGLEAARRIRELQGLHQIPIIVLSAHESEEFRERAAASGASAYLTKPVDFSELEQVIERLLRLTS
jgi:two-component system, cell cycle response regulator DivK